MIKKVLVFYLLLISALFGENKNDRLNRIVNHTCNLELETASQMLQEWAPENDLGRAEKYYNLARIGFLRYLGSEDSAALNDMKTFISSALFFTEAVNEESDTSYLAYYIEGAVLTMRAFTESRKGNSISAFWDSKNAVSAFEECLEINPEFYDAYQGLGMFNYALSYVPGIYNLAISLSGLSSDKEKGLNYLETAWQKGTYDKADAGFNLAKIYMDYIAEYDSAEVIYKELLGKYPKNVLYAYQYAILKYRVKEYKKSLELLDKVIKLNHPDFVQTTSYAAFLKGDVYYATGEYAKAYENYNKFLTTSLNSDYFGIANYRAAVCAKLTGDDETARKHLMLSGNGNDDIAEDKYAEEKGNYIIKHGFSETELKLQKIETFLNLNKPKVAVDSLNAMITKGVNDSSAALAYYFMSKAAFETRDYGMAEKFAKKSIKNKKYFDNWVNTASSIILAQIYYSGGREDLARDYLEDAEDENSYQKSEIYSAKINNLKRKYNFR